VFNVKTVKFSVCFCS